MKVVNFGTNGVSGINQSLQKAIAGGYEWKLTMPI